MGDISSVNTKYIFLSDGTRIRTDFETLIKIKAYANNYYELYSAMYSESQRIADEYKAEVDKMPFHTQEEIDSLHNCIAAIPLELDNQYRVEAINQWSGMLIIISKYSQYMGHWKKIHWQATHAVNEWKNYR